MNCKIEKRKRTRIERRKRERDREKPFWTDIDGYFTGLSENFRNPFRFS